MNESRKTAYIGCKLYEKTVRTPFLQVMMRANKNKSNVSTQSFLLFFIKIPPYRKTPSG